jgi:hypothetical protein
MKWTVWNLVSAWCNTGWMLQKWPFVFLYLYFFYLYLYFFYLYFVFILFYFVFCNIFVNNEGTFWHVVQSNWSFSFISKVNFICRNTLTWTIRNIVHLWCYWTVVNSELFHCTGILTWMTIKKIMVKNKICNLSFTFIHIHKSMIQVCIMSYHISSCTVTNNACNSIQGESPYWYLFKVSHLTAEIQLTHLY